MPETAISPAHFELDASILRRQRRVLGVALAWYLPAGLILTAAAALVATWPGDLVPAALIAVGAAQVDYYVVAAIAQFWLSDRDLGRAGAAGGRLTLSGDGIHTGLRWVTWQQVTRVRVRRDGVPHVAVSWRRSARGRRRAMPLRPAWYNVSTDAMADAFARFATIEIKARPRAPVFDEPPGTVTFFANLIDLRARRDRHRRGAWRLIGMLYPPAIGLFVAHQIAAAAAVFAVLVLLVIRQLRKLAPLKRPLTLDRGGRGRLELTADHVTLAGTSVPIPWSHVQGATITTRDGRSGLSGVIACPDGEPEPSCRFTNRTITFHIDEALYNTTVDDIASAFARYTTVAPSADLAL